MASRERYKRSSIKWPIIGYYIGIITCGLYMMQSLKSEIGLMDIRK